MAKNTVHVTDSFKLSFGRIVVFLQCAEGRLPEGTVLEDAHKKQWKATRYYQPFSSLGGYELLKQREANNIYEHYLDGIGHDDKPPKDTALHVVP